MIRFLFLLLCFFSIGWSWPSGWGVGKIPADDVEVEITNFDGNLSSADTDIQKALETIDDMAVGAGAGDVGSVGDCTDGACLDGSNDGGTYLRLYDGDSNYTQVSPSNTSSNVTITLPASTGTLLLTTGNAATASALAADPADCSAGKVATAINASGALTCSITPLVSGGTLTTNYHCRYDGTGIDCDRVEDASGTCAANAVCMGGHTHPTTEISGVSAGTDLTADLEEEVTEGSLADSTIVSADIKDGTITNADITSTLDLGGATSFEIPNSSDPALDATGEIALDTTSNHIEFYDGSAKQSLSAKRQFCFTLPSPTDSDDNIPVFFPREAITITDVYCEVDGGTSVSMTLSDGTNALEAITCDADGAEDDGSIANGTFTANERIEFDLASTSGTNTFLSVCVSYILTEN